MRKFLHLTIAGLLTASSLQAGGEGSNGAPFLKVPVNARATAMAGAFTGIHADATSMEYNPAGLAGIHRGDISLTYLDHLEDTSFQSVGIGFPIGKKSDPDADGLTPRTLTGGFQFRQFSADDDTRSDLGVKTGTLDIRDQLYHLAGAISLTDRIAVGGGFKYISQRLADASLTTFAADAGVLWRAPARVTVGASLLNMGPAKAFEAEADPLPTLLRVGASRVFGPVLVALDATQGRDGVSRFAGGGEWLVGKIVRLRGGAYQQTDELAFTAGLGVMAAGPMKSPPSSSSFRSGAVSRERAASAGTTELSFNERRAADLLDRLSALASDLIERFHRSGHSPADNTLAVLPAHGAGERMGGALADLLGQQLQQEFPVIESARVDKGLRELAFPFNLDDEEAARLGRLIGARAVVVQQLVPSGNTYKLFARVILVETEQSVAAATATFAQDVFRGGSQKKSLAAAPAAGTARTSSNPPDRVLWGIDYGLTSRDTFGLSHTVSLRILY